MKEEAGGGGAERELARNLLCLRHILGISLTQRGTQGSSGSGNSFL